MTGADHVHMCSICHGDLPSQHDFTPEATGVTSHVCLITQIWACLLAVRALAQSSRLGHVGQLAPFDPSACLHQNRKACIKLARDTCSFVTYQDTAVTDQYRHLGCPPTKMLLFVCLSLSVCLSILLLSKSLPIHLAVPLKGFSCSLVLQQQSAHTFCLAGTLLSTNKSSGCSAGTP